MLKKAKLALGILIRKVLSGPMEVSIDLTRKCTLNCVMCWWRSSLITEPSASKWLDEEMDYALVEKLIKDLGKMHTKRVILGGQGDPFLYPKLFDVIKALKKAKIEVVLITSGSYLNSQRVKNIFQSGLDYLDISLHAAQEATYLKIHPNQKEGSFGRIKEQLISLSLLKKASGKSTPKVQIIYVICKVNYLETVQIIDFAREVGADSIGFKRISVVPETKKLLLSAKELDELKVLLDKAALKAKELGIGTEISNYKKYILNGLTTGIYTTDFYASIPCYVGYYGARILVNGNVIPCCGCYEYILGNVNDSSFRDIWYSKSYRQFRLLAQKTEKKALLDKQCKCYSCVDHGSNLGIYRKLHPIKIRKLNK